METINNKAAEELLEKQRQVALEQSRVTLEQLEQLREKLSNNLRLLEVTNE